MHKHRWKHCLHTYDRGSSSQSYCTSIGNNLSCTTFNDSYRETRIQQDYVAGQVIGTSLGNAVMSAIEMYREKKRIRQAKQDQWDQFVQDTLAGQELDCEAEAKTNPKGPTVIGCGTMIFTLNQFLHRHRKDFVVDGNNVMLLADSLEKTAPADQSTWTEEILETAFQTVDKKNSTKRFTLGLVQIKRSGKPQK